MVLWVNRLSKTLKSADILFTLTLPCGVTYNLRRSREGSDVSVIYGDYCRAPNMGCASVSKTKNKRSKNNLRGWFAHVTWFPNWILPDSQNTYQTTQITMEASLDVEWSKVIRDCGKRWPRRTFKELRLGQVSVQLVEVFKKPRKRQRRDRFDYARRIVESDRRQLDTTAFPV